MINNIIKLANKLDRDGFKKEASMLDALIKKKAVFLEDHKYPEVREKHGPDGRLEKCLVCPEGYYLSNNDDLCYPSAATCPPGQSWNEETGQCEPPEAEEPPLTLPGDTNLDSPFRGSGNPADDLWSGASIHEPSSVKRGGW